MKKMGTILLTMFFILNILIIPAMAETMDISPVTNTTPTVPGEIVDKTYDIWDTVSAVITTIGVGIAVIMLIVVAIKYMSSAPSDKAEIKKYIVIYVVGAIFIFCCVGIVNLLKGLAGELLL